jgi:hypothetical protein
VQPLDADDHVRGAPTGRVILIGGNGEATLLEALAG